jgi:hypothetical protein
MKILLALVLLGTVAHADPITWDKDEANHTRLLGKGMHGRALGAVEQMLANAGYHMTHAKLVMKDTPTAARQGTLSVDYETSVTQPSCPKGAPCRNVQPKHAYVELGCVQFSKAPPDSCDDLRSVKFQAE